MGKRNVRYVFQLVQIVHRAFNAIKYGLIIFGTLWVDRLLTRHPSEVFRWCIFGIVLILLQKLLWFESERYAIYFLCSRFEPESRAFDIDDILQGGGENDFCYMKRRE